MVNDQERHRPGLLKQQNKAHKHGRHRSKGAVQVEQKGRTAPKVISKRYRNKISKEERRNKMFQTRQKKRMETMQKKRELGNSTNAPFLIAVVPLNLNVDAEKLMTFVKNCCDNNDLARSPEDVLHINCNRLKQKFSFIFPQKGNVYSVLDSLKIANTVLFVVSAAADPVIDSESESILTAVLCQGLPSCVAAAIDLETLPLKKKSNCKQDMQKAISRWLPTEKIFQVEKEMDGLNLLRKIGNQKQKTICHRDRRPHLLGEQIEFVKKEDSTFGVLKVSGYLRGQQLLVNSLVHIPGWGDFQMKQIDTYTNGSHEPTVQRIADPSKQTSLESENTPDPMDAEQTWPTNEELEDAEKERKAKKLIKKIPKGMSDYQACWIPDDEIEEVDDLCASSDEEGDVVEPMVDDWSDDDIVERKVKFIDDEKMEAMTETEGEMEEDKYDEIMDFDEEKKAREQIKEARMDLLFPDEIDTPVDIPAKIRFQKYRGLSSFRTSPWDPKENLPYDYARIFQFENFNKTKKRILNDLQTPKLDGVDPGLYVTIHIDNVPSSLYQSRQSHEPIVVIGMLEHEQKMSVINVVLKRCQNTPWAGIPIKSKDQLIFHCGYRRYKVRPIFSQHTNGSKHKYERYFQPNSVTVATMFAPIVFPPASVLVFKENPNGTQDVVATGSVLSVTPDRLVIKRVVLSGHPFKINKRSAVIRFMFFNREDIRWFKPVELKTKCGRRGHIREPLGTHGHMKAVFDAQLKSQDVVLMLLYKRVFPKWSYDPTIKYTNSRYRCLSMTVEEDQEMEQ
ncbi:hypothetical protein RUM44_000807 [Polyplax serrata]|uniref:Pre-rRNA-processing protein TSR1 homolog n=1 Tax=Polyplax serrata TaxID=468196 RepID=A0ABR1B679_POLSC